MGSLSPEERPVVGKLVNEAKGEVEAKLEEVGTAIKTKEKNAKLASEVIDISLPGKKQVIGKRHPLDLIIERMKEIFIYTIGKIWEQTIGSCFWIYLIDTC